MFPLKRVHLLKFYVKTNKITNNVLSHHKGKSNRKLKHNLNLSQGPESLQKEEKQEAGEQKFLFLNH